MKVKLTLEYAGEAFHGWQVQGGLNTVQGALEDALEIFLRGEAKKAGKESPGRIFISGSGRTDSGVHARGQVATFIWPPAFNFEASRLKEALNAITSQALLVRKVESVEDEFDARHSPHVKCYSYRISYWGEISHSPRYSALEPSRVWVVSKNLDVGKMIRAARLIEGQQDFESFRAKDCSAKSTVRTILRSELVRTSANELTYFIHGKGFLKQMVRIIVGTLVELGLDPDRPFTAVQEIILSRDRSSAGKTAPAQGLCMEWVDYDCGACF